MSRLTRVVLAFVLAEAILVGIWVYLARLGIENPDRAAPEFQETLGSTMGTVVGVVTALFLVLLYLAWRAGRRA